MTQTTKSPKIAAASLSIVTALALAILKLLTGFFTGSAIQAGDRGEEHGQRKYRGGQSQSHYRQEAGQEGLHRTQETPTWGMLGI